MEIHALMEIHASIAAARSRNARTSAFDERTGFEQPLRPASALIEERRHSPQGIYGQ
jgi:hypothetical protein